MNAHQSDSGGDKVIIVEGKTDRERILQILGERVEILCTNGTLGYERLQELALHWQHDDVYILVDADEPGMKLRNQLKQELPNARHLYTRKMYREVAFTPMSYLAKMLQDAHFEVDERWLHGEETE